MTSPTQCPKFISCSLPRCPLDPEANLRVQLSEDGKCPNWYFLGIRVHKKGREGRRLRSVGVILRTIGQKSVECPTNDFNK
jgi:hypothetical protein